MIKFADMQVQYIDHLGSDINVVNAARCSFAKEVTEFDLEKDTKLINYLAKHNHWSPLAHTSVSVRVKAPIFMARQFVKHQIGLVWNEESRRYIDDEPEFYKPTSWRCKPENVKQGSGTESIIGESIWGFDSIEEDYQEHLSDSLELYNSMIHQRIAPELARTVLPQSVMTNWMWTGSLVAFARIVKLRTEEHAQIEAQELAKKIEEVVAPLYPVSWKALMNYMKV